MNYSFDTLSTPFMTFAAPYGACTYGSQAFQDGNCSTTETGGGTGGTGGTTGSTTTTTTQSGSPLTNTGFSVGLIIGLAALILLAALIVRFVKRPAKVVTATPTDVVAAAPTPKTPKKVQL